MKNSNFSIYVKVPQAENPRFVISQRIFIRFFILMLKPNLIKNEVGERKKLIGRDKLVGRKSLK
jgi:hypothetical protein